MSLEIQQNTKCLVQSFSFLMKHGQRKEGNEKNGEMPEFLRTTIQQLFPKFFPCVRRQTPHVCYKLVQSHWIPGLTELNIMYARSAVSLPPQDGPVLSLHLLKTDGNCLWSDSAHPKEPATVFLRKAVYKHLSPRSVVNFYRNSDFAECQACNKMCSIP